MAAKSSHGLLPLAGDDLPQIAISGGALVSAAPTKQTVVLPQISQNSQMVRLRKIVAEVSLPPQQQSASHRFHRIHRTSC